MTLMRSFFLNLSGSPAARRALMKLPFAARFSQRFVAGETLDDAMRVVKVLNTKGLLATLDHLGENVHTETDANRATQDYLALLERIAAEGVKSGASLKLTQLGLDIGEELCITNMTRILECARKFDNFVRIDMESSAYTDRTVKVFRALRQSGFNNVGIVMQAYLYRTEKDMQALAANGANIRLCKGAYREPPEIAFPNKTDVDSNYIRLTKLYFDAIIAGSSAYIAIATHDDKMIDAAKQYVQKHGISNDKFEFQMLYGIRPQLQEGLAAEGYKVRIYVPYGTEWYPYFMRRLAERPANVWFILKNLFRA